MRLHLCLHLPSYFSCQNLYMLPGLFRRLRGRPHTQHLAVVPAQETWSISALERIPVQRRQG